MRWLAIVFLLAVVASGSALAGQDDPRLDALFDRLSATDDPAEIRWIEGRIWLIWMTYDGGDDDVGRLMRQGQQAQADDDLAAAEGYYDRVVERAPDFAEGWNRRATVRYLRGDFIGSIADIEATLALEPRHFGALAGLGLCHLGLAQLEQALDAFERALTVNRHLAGARAHAEALRMMLSGQPI